jgi:hypothetical protein
MNLKKLFLLFQWILAFSCLGVNMYGQDGVPSFALPPGWEVLREFNSSMPITTTIRIKGVEQNTTGVAIGAFVVGTDECRGVASPIDYSDWGLGYLTFLTVQGNSEEDISIYYKVCKAGSDMEYPATIPGASDFDDERSVGTPFEPVVSKVTTPRSGITLGAYSNGSGAERSAVRQQTTSRARPSP